MSQLQLQGSLHVEGKGLGGLIETNVPARIEAHTENTWGLFVKLAGKQIR